MSWPWLHTIFSQLLFLASWAPLVKNLECEEDEVEGLLPVLPSSEQVEVLVVVLVVEDSTLLE